MRYPVNNPRVTSDYGPRTRDGFHYGIYLVDTSNPTGPIFATEAGIVVKAVNEAGSGNVVKLRHNGYFTIYAHCSALHVRNGQNVAEGQHIANIGRTGNTTGNHLHFEMKHTSNNQPFDPRPYLSAKPNPPRKEEDPDMAVVPRETAREIVHAETGESPETAGIPIDNIQGKELYARCARYNRARMQQEIAHRDKIIATYEDELGELKKETEQGERAYVKLLAERAKLEQDNARLETALRRYMEDTSPKRRMIPRPKAVPSALSRFLGSLFKRKNERG